MAVAISHDLAYKAHSPWKEFTPGLWQKRIDVRDFIQQNLQPYEGDESFLAAATQRTQTLWNQLNELFVEERRNSWTQWIIPRNIPNSRSASQDMR